MAANSLLALPIISANTSSNQGANVAEREPSSRCGQDVHAIRPPAMTPAERMRHWRARRRAQSVAELALNSSITLESAPGTGPATCAERNRHYRERKRARIMVEFVEQACLPDDGGDIAVTGSDPSFGQFRRIQSDPECQQSQHLPSVGHRTNVVRDPMYLTDFWPRATAYFEKKFLNNQLGHICDVCDRLWFIDDLKTSTESLASVLEPAFGPRYINFKLCSNCYATVKRGTLPAYSTTNGFKYPPKPPGLPPLDPITTRLISPRIPFMSLRRLRRDGSLGIIGQVINVPVDVNSMVTKLPRQLDDDYAINVSIKKRLFHTSSYLHGFVKKRNIKAWLEFLINQPLYRYYNIEIDRSALGDDSSEMPRRKDKEGSDSDSDCHQVQQNAELRRAAAAAVGDDGDDRCLFERSLIEPLDEDGPHYRASVSLLARQHTLLWNEDCVIDLAPAEGNRPLNLIFDQHAEELSFPGIYYGCDRQFNPNCRATPYVIANSEIRRRDRRGATPEHVLYMAMKILRIRVVDGITRTFRHVRDTENITRRMIEDTHFLADCVERDLAFLRSIPNSCHYWQVRKLDVFAMIRQFGRPTLFMTLSASECNWPNLLAVLHRLSYDQRFKDVAHVNDLTDSMRAHLVNEDPVICCLYFHKLVEVIMSMLCKATGFNPFGRYRVLDYFMRVEFQHRGSPHAHILLWLANDPNEQVSESMPRTIQLVTDLMSISSSDVPSLEHHMHQVHRHTFTCQRRGETKCRFNIPYWPMRETCVLLPLARDDGRKETFRLHAKRARKLLEEKEYDSIEAYLDDVRVTDYDNYLNLVRSTLTKCAVFVKRQPSERMINTFNPWIASVLNSNMDLQFILDEYSCANYVVNYVNKANRGMSNLHRELTKLTTEYPHLSQDNLLRKIGIRILNSVEMSSQEAAWCLLRQPMSRISRKVIFIPTCPPEERLKSYKSRTQLAKLSSDSKDIWTKNIIQKYEDRPHNLENFCLADFAAHCKLRRLHADGDDDDDDVNNLEERPEDLHDYSGRKDNRIIRYRNYDSTDVNNFMREMVTLFVPFRNEQSDVIDRNMYITTYSNNLDLICARRSDYEKVANLEQLVDEILQAEKYANEPANDASDESGRVRDLFARQVLGDNVEEDFDDFNAGIMATRSGQNRFGVVSAMRKRDNVLSKEDYCTMMRSTNHRQRELILEVLHRLHTPGMAPLQFFLTGPAGCGKTYVLKLIMDTINRFTSEETNDFNNSYLACASTGKAAVNLGGTTVHAAFHIAPSRPTGPIREEALHRFRALFNGVRCVIVDEVSMIGEQLLQQVNRRLQQITGNLDDIFGSMPMIFCGDFRQLPPVCAIPVYKPSRGRLCSNILWQMLDYFHLDQVMRQSDSIFSTILTKIGDGRVLESSESELIESRFRTESWCDENLPDVVRLFHLNSRVDSYNRRILHDGHNVVAKDTFTGYKTNDQMLVARTRLHKLNTMESSGLPYCLQLKLNKPYMITTNVAIADGLVNGAIGILKSYGQYSASRFTSGRAEYDFTANEASLDNHTNDSHNIANDELLTVVWLQFDDERVGSHARLNARELLRDAQANRSLSSAWTPILERSTTINLGGSIKCRRVQLPLAPACAITIHKSQGGTFKSAVVNYEKSLINSLVYVALSRVQSLDGLYLINDKNDYNFHHKRGNTGPLIREVRDEYQRLSRHPLPTLTSSLINDFINEISHRDIIVCTINAQSLLAHKHDIDSDQVLTKCDILCVTETWMTSDSLVQLAQYQLIGYSNASLATVSTVGQAGLESAEMASTSANLPSNRRRCSAGGVAIYLKKDSASFIRIRNGNSSSFAFSSAGLAEIVFVELEVKSRNCAMDNKSSPGVCDTSLTGVILFGAVYMHPSQSKARVKRFLEHVFSGKISGDNGELVIIDSPRMFLTGDFNIDVKFDNWLVELMANKYTLDYVSTSSDQPTTLGCTTIDLTFIRQLSVTCRPYVAYFSYHRPLIHKLEVTCG